MEDTIKSTATFEVGLEYNDGTTTQKATIKIPNPKSGINLRDAITSAFTEYSGMGFYDSSNGFHSIKTDMIVTGSTTNETVRIIDIGAE